MRRSRRGGRRARCPCPSREPVLSAAWSTRASKSRRASSSRDQHPRARSAGRPAGVKPPVHDRGETVPSGRNQCAVRLERLGQNLSRQLAILELSTKIQEQVGSELTKAQREHFLRQQLKAIQDELGESENENPGDRANFGNVSRRPIPLAKFRPRRNGSSSGWLECTRARPNTRSSVPISIG